MTQDFRERPRSFLPSQTKASRVRDILQHQQPAAKTTMPVTTAPPRITSLKAPPPAYSQLPAKRTHQTTAAITAVTGSSNHSSRTKLKNPKGPKTFSNARHYSRALAAAASVPAAARPTCPQPHISTRPHPMLINKVQNEIRTGVFVSLSA